MEHLPTTNVSDGSPIKFHVSGDSNHYTDLSKSYLYPEVKIVKADGSDLGNDDKVGPINLIGQTHFQQVDVSLNDVLVSDASNLYHYRALIETLLSYKNEAKTSQLTMSMYYKDKVDAMDNVADSNTGLVARWSLTAGSIVVPLIGKIHSDMFYQHRYLLNGVGNNLKIKLLRNANKFILMVTGTSTYKLQVVCSSFFVRKIKLNNGIQLKHIEKMEKQLQPARYLCNGLGVRLTHHSIATYTVAAITGCA